MDSFLKPGDSMASSHEWLTKVKFKRAESEISDDDTVGNNGEDDETGDDEDDKTKDEEGKEKCNAIFYCIFFIACNDRS